MLSPTEKSPGKHRKTRNVINLVFIVVAIVAMAGIALSPSPTPPVWFVVGLAGVLIKMIEVTWRMMDR